MAGTYELDQATGAAAQMVLAQETDWGVVNASPNCKYLNVVPGEGLDENIQTYASQVIRNDGMSNPDVRGTTRPGGALPFELAPMGVSQLIYQLLGWHVSTSGSGPYTHVLKGTNRSAALPIGFTVEKGFMDLATPTFFGILGCRVNVGTFNFGVDQPISGSFDIHGREWFSDTTSVFDGETPADLTADPFTSVDITVYEGSSLVVLGTATQLSLSIANNMNITNFALGSNYRKNLKRGTRLTTFSGTFMFNNADLYNKARLGTDTKIQIVCSNGTYSHTIYMPAVDFLPNNSSPKISTDGVLSITLNGKATKGASDATDLVWTIVSPEASIIN